VGAFDVTDPTFQDLVARVIRTNARVVPFVGAGLSLYGPPSQRLPLWRDLVLRLVAEGKRSGVLDDHAEQSIRAALKDRRYVEAIDHVIASLGEPTFRRCVQLELDVANKPIPPAITELVAIGWSLIVTTNLDKFISEAYQKRHGRSINAVPGIDTHRLVSVLAGLDGSKETSLAQIHGDLESYPSWCLTGNDYKALLQDPGYMAALKHLFLREVFFIGFGLQDDDFDLLLDTIGTIFPAGAGEFFALLPEDRRGDVRVVELIRKNGLRPIFYPVDRTIEDDPYAGHGAVHECLRYLAKEWASVSLDLPISMKYFPELDPDMIGRETALAHLRDRAIAVCGTSLQVVGIGGVGKTMLVQQFIERNRYELARTGYKCVFGFSFVRPEIGQFVRDFELATLGSSKLPLHAKVERLAAYAKRNRILLVLDGFENLATGSDGEPDTNLKAILGAVREGNGTILATTRFPVDSLGESIAISPLLPNESFRLFADWYQGELSNFDRDQLFELTEGHPLALRVLGGLLSGTEEFNFPTQLSLDERAIESMFVDDQLSMVMSRYLDLLSDVECDFLMGFSIFVDPTSYPLVDDILSHDYVDDTINRRLVGLDLRTVVSQLQRKGLLKISEQGRLTAPPTVRDFFRNQVKLDGRMIAPLHRRVASVLSNASMDLPETLEGMLPLVSACRHAAASGDWTLFHDLFRRRIMRGWLDFMCDNLGGWQEAYGLAKLVRFSTLPEAGSASAYSDNDVYYSSIEARCLKHIGLTRESLDRYDETISRAFSLRHQDSAMFVNNLLTMLVWRGNLAAAELLVQPNLAAIGWIVDEWKLRWQREHGLSSIAYLRALQGEVSQSRSLFDLSRQSWDGFTAGRTAIFDIYPMYESELDVLESPPQFEPAMRRLFDLLAEASSEQWPEAIARAHIQISGVYRREAHLGTEASVSLNAAQSRLNDASKDRAAMALSDVWIAHAIEAVKVRFDRQRLCGQPLDIASARGDLEAIRSRIERSQLYLALPEALALGGLLDLIEGDGERASELYHLSTRHALQQGNQLLLVSSLSAVSMLRKALGFAALSIGSPRLQDPSELFGQKANDSELIEIVKEAISLARADEHAHF
jgi:hypothetical protein